MANEPKPQSGNTGTGAKVGGAGVKDAGGSGDRGGARDEKTADAAKRGISETNSPRKPG
jgi:hypothetical protein